MLRSAFSVRCMSLPSVDSSSTLVALVEVTWLTHRKLYGSGQSVLVTPSVLSSLPAFQWAFSLPQCIILKIGNNRVWTSWFCSGRNRDTAFD